VVTRENNRVPLRIEPFDPEYDRKIDEETGDYVGPTVKQYNNSVINAIHIPLGNVRDKFTKQTWYLSVGSHEISSNPTSMGFTFTTYGNYYNLFKYVRNIDDTFLL